jgi:hypothetical protein
MRNDLRSSARKSFLAIVAALAGGTTVTSCDSRVKTAVVGALEQTVLSIFDPANYLDEDSLLLD